MGVFTDVCGLRIQNRFNHQIQTITDMAIIKVDFNSGRSVGPHSEKTFFVFMRETIALLDSMGRVRTAETYRSSLNSFMRFRKGADLPFYLLDSDLIMAYETWLIRSGVCPNTSSFYLRNLRAVFNRGIEKGFSVHDNPFRHVYTGVDKTRKRAIPMEDIRQLMNMDFNRLPAQEFARDMFLFSFYTRGMSFVDMSFLRKDDLKDGNLVYKRRKTGQRLVVKWESCMQRIVDKYEMEGSPYLLPVINVNSAEDERRQYLRMAHNINRSLKKIGQEMWLQFPLTMYVARHSWASIARDKQIPVSVISQCMGHESEKTTRIYLASLNTDVLDHANHSVLEDLFSD